MFRISLGLSSMFLSVLFIARSLELLPDPHAAEMARRQTLCEALAVECALAGKQQASFADVESLALAFAMRDKQLLSVGVRDAGGKLAVDIGGHEEHWSGMSDEQSDPSHLFAPVFQADGEPWAKVELAFAALAYDGWWRYFGGSLFPLFTFIGAAGGMVSYLYLRLVFRKVDGVKSKLVPSRVRDTLNTLAEGVLVLDRKGRIALANDAFARSVSSTADQLQGRKASELPWHRGTTPMTQDDHPWVRVLRESAPQMGQVLGLKSAADGMTMSVNAAPIIGEDGQCRGALATFDDITPIEKARRAAEAANKAKGEFLANVSHEIRTPMNAIIGMTDLVLESRLNAENRECLEIVQESASNLMAVINDLLDMSKIEAGKFSLDPIDFAMQELIEDSLAPLALRAHKKGIELVCDVASDVPPELHGDPVRLRQVIVNLVGNAVKFTEKGEIVVRVRLKREVLDEFDLQFSVSDTGCGIAQDKLQLIFEPFTQEDGSTSRKFGGTGLGLSISTHLAELMSGQIWAESTPGQGSTFHFTGRFRPCVRVSGRFAKPDDRSLGQMPVLVVDDNDTARQVLTDVLTKVGARPSAADSLAAARAVLQQADDKPFRMVVIDSDLAGESGFDLVADAIKVVPPTSVAVMVSSADLQRDVARCRELGIRYFRKPVKKADLIAAMREVVEVSSPSVSTGTPLPAHADLSSAMAPSPLRVLLVEDNPFNQKVAAMKLERFGHSVRIAGDGAAALAALQQTVFDIVFTDIHMPDMDGFELTAAIREWEVAAGKHIVVVAMTAHAAAGISDRCLAAGMDGYLSKPINDSDLMNALRLAKPQQSAVAAPVDSQVSTIMRKSATSFDGEAMMERVGGDVVVLQRLIQVYRQDAGSLMSDLTRALKAGDAKGVRSAAHTIKGMVSFFDAADATDAAYRLEQAGERGNLTAAERVFVTLQQELAALNAGLDQFVSRLPELVGV